MDLTPDHRLKDLIRIERRGIERIATFPEILRDSNGKYIGIVSLDGVRIDNPMVAFLIDLIKWGYENLESHSKLKRPLPEGETLNLPEPAYVEGLRFKTSRPLREFFQFVTETPGGTKKSRTWFHSPGLSTGRRGYKDVYSGGTAFEAACLAAVQTGYMIRMYDNGIPNFHVDDTQERLAYLGTRMAAHDFPSIVRDSRWGMMDNSMPSRGVCHYERRVVFNRELTQEQLDVYREYLSLDNCPGWTEIYVRREGTEYIFRTTMDSSD